MKNFLLVIIFNLCCSLVSFGNQSAALDDDWSTAQSYLSPSENHQQCVGLSEEEIDLTPEDRKILLLKDAFHSSSITVFSTVYIQNGHKYSRFQGRSHLYKLCVLRL